MLVRGPIWSYHGGQQANELFTGSIWSLHLLQSTPVQLSRNMEKQSIIIVSKLCFDMRKHQHPKSYSEKILSSYCNLLIEHCTIDFAIIYTTIWLFLHCKLSSICLAYFHIYGSLYHYGSFCGLWLFFIVMALFDRYGSF